MRQTIPCGDEPEKVREFPKLFGDSLPTQGLNPIARESSGIDSPPEQTAEQHTKSLTSAALNTSNPSVSNSAGWQHRGGEAYGWRQPAASQSRQSVAENPCTSQETELLTVVELAARLKCSPSFIYRRLNRGHPQYIPHIRLTPTDIRFNSRVIADLLPKSENGSVSLGPSVQPGGIVGCTRHRDRKGSLLIRGKKRKLWLSQWPEGNKRMSHKLGWHNAMSRSQAERAHRQWMEKLNRQREIAGESITLESFFAQHYWNEETKSFGDELMNKRASTQRDMKNAALQVLLPRFGKHDMGSLKTGEIQSYLVSRIGPPEEGKISRRTALKYKTYLSSMFSAAMRLEAGVTRNPVRPVKLTVEEPQKSVFVLDDLQTQLIARELHDPRHIMMWNMNLWMGNRIGETRALRVNSVDWETGVVTVTESLFEGKSNRPKTKAGERLVVLNEAQLAELRKYQEEHLPDADPEGWLFPGKRGRPIQAGWFMRKVIKPIATKLGFPEIHWHALRHWNNSAMLNAGVDPAVRMKRVGHTNIRTNLIYSHSDLALQRSASDAVWQRLEAAKQELEKQKAGSQTPPSRLTVTLSVTPNQGLPVSP